MPMIEPLTLAIGLTAAASALLVVGAYLIGYHVGYQRGHYDGTMRGFGRMFRGD